MPKEVRNVFDKFDGVRSEFFEQDVETSLAIDANILRNQNRQRLILERDKEI